MATGPELYREAYDLLLGMPTIEEVEENPELEELWTEQLVAWADQAQDKIGAYRAVFRAAASRERAFKEEAARFTKAAKRETRVQKSLEGLATLLLTAAEETTGTAAIETADGSDVKLRSRKQPKIMAIDMDKLPAVYVRTKTEPDKNAITKVCRAGEVPPGVEWDAERRSIRVDWGP
jgi:hypothetical protein